MGAVTALRPTPQGMIGNPAWLAAGAAGFASAMLALWAFRGLPLGTLVLWFAAAPIFAAGLGFGLVSAVSAAGLAALLVWGFGKGIAAVIYLALFGAPAPLLLAAGLRGGGFQPGLPLALLGLWPVAVLLATAFLVVPEGGIEAAMRNAVRAALGAVGVPASEGMIAQIVRVKAAAIGFWAALSLLVSCLLATALLRRAGVLRVVLQAWEQVRLPSWYPALPAIGAVIALAAPAGEDAIAVSVLLLLLVPLFLQGLAGLHRRLAGRPRARLMLGGGYLLLLIFPHLLGPGLVLLGLYDHFLGRPAPHNS
jgi:hypothetical protein